MKIAFSHDWLNGMRGGEKCLDNLLRDYPNSEIYTLIHEKGKCSDLIESKKIHTSSMQKIPFALKKYKLFLPFFHQFIRTLKVESCDAIVSTSHCVAKALPKPSNDTPHISYCFTPMRYAWLFFDEYFGSFPKWTHGLIKALLARLRVWDKRTSPQVTHFIAISDHIKKRIRKFYDRDAAVIYPPVDTGFYNSTNEVRGDFYLMVAALVPYKKTDLAIEAFNRLGKKLVVIGTGPEKERLEKMANSNISFLGFASNETIRRHYQTCQALIFPQEEDFGIVPVEAQACGAPVIAFKEGGALETVIDGKTGIFFDEQTSKSLEETVERFQTMSWDDDFIRQHAEKFSEERFRFEMKTFIDSVVKKHLEGARA